jgi:hypothetical protein
LLQNRAILRNAMRTSLPLVSSEKHAAQRSEQLRKKRSLNYWLDTGKGEGASVSVFKDKAGADESVRLAADYVHTHLCKLRIQKPEIIEGPIKAHD